MDVLRSIIRPLPDFTWRRVAGMYGHTITPMYKSIQNMLNEDAEHVAQILYELEPPSEEDFICDSESSPCLYSQAVHANRGEVLTPERLRRKRRRSHSPVGESMDEPMHIVTLFLL
jgi:hypothetical protein